MGLPKIEHPMFETTLPITGKKVKYHAMTVKDEKTLLIAKESDDIEQSILGLKQLMANCVVDIETDDIPISDFEYLFIKMRSTSINNLVEFTFKDPDTNEEVDCEVDLDDVKVRSYEDHTNRINITDDIMLVMRYPTIDEYTVFAKALKDPAQQLGIIIACIDTVASGDDLFNLSDFSKEEVEEFFNDFTDKNIQDIGHFFKTIPTVYFEARYMNSKGEPKTFVIEGLRNFFN